MLHLFLLVVNAWRTSFKEQTRVSRLSAFLNPDFDTLHSYPLPSPGLSSSDRLPFRLEENGGTPFTTKASGRHHHHHHQHQHHTNYGLSLTLENKEGLARSPNSSSKSLTSKLGIGGEVGERRGWAMEGERAIAWLGSQEIFRKGFRYTLITKHFAL